MYERLATAQLHVAASAFPIVTILGARQIDQSLIEVWLQEKVSKR